MTRIATICLLGIAVSLSPAPAARAALPVYIELFDDSGAPIEGSARVLDFDGVVPGSEFVHAWMEPFDGDRPAGRARLEELTVTIPAGEPGIALMGAMTRNAALERVVFHFLRATRGGDLEEFFRITVEDVHVTRLRTVLPDTLDPENASRELTQVVGLIYDRVSFERAEVERRRYVRGDINDDLRVDVSDAVRLLLHLFAGRVAACPAAGDSNGDSEVDVSDVAYLLNHLFRGGPPVPPPFPGCGVVPPGQSCDAHACSAV